MIIPVGGITIKEDILEDWAKRIEKRGYDSPETKTEWLNLIIDAVKKDQEFDEYGDG
jgi:hypothetical protein